MTADTGRRDYDQAIKLAGLEAGEPIFVIRGRDAVSGDTVRAWAGLAFKAGAPDEAIELALQQADRLDAWPNKKAPDGPQLDDNARKQLRYELARRAWNGRKTVDNAAGVLAHQLGQSEFIGRLRPILGDLAGHVLIDGDHVVVSPEAGDALTRLFALAGQDLAGRARKPE